MGNCLECHAKVEDHYKTTGRPKLYCSTKCKNAYLYKSRKFLKVKNNRETANREGFIEGKLSPERLKLIQKDAYIELWTLLQKIKELDAEDYEHAKLVIKIIDIARKSKYFLLFDDDPFNLSQVRKGLSKDFIQITIDGVDKFILTDSQREELQSVLWNIYEAEDYSELEDKGKRDNHYAVARKQAADSGLIYPLPPTNDELKELVLQRLGVSEDE